jgi:DNA mismatch repair ATPase MutS
VIFGSNMGGKTVVLKTLAFLQLLAQAGLFVPARRFETRVFHRFHYVGEGRRREEGRGLSGFGFEIRQFNEAHADFGDDTLALFDEFARTTSSAEAEALLSAILEELAGCPRVVAVFSTHFRGVKRLEGVRYLRMGGLDRSRLDLAAPAGEDLAGRIRHIDRQMRFCLEPDVPGERRSDALAVAALLGLSPALARRAEDFLNHED